MRKKLSFLLISCFILCNVRAFAAGRTVEGVLEPVNDVTLSAGASGAVMTIKIQEGEFAKQGTAILELDEIDSSRKRAEALKQDWETSLAVSKKTQSISRDELNKKEVEYAAAEEQYKKRQALAPFDGVVIKIHPKIGETCNQGQPLVRIADNRRCRFIAHLDPADGRSLKTGAKIRLNVSDGSAAMAREGVVEYIASLPDTASGLREIKVLLDNFDGKVQSGVAATMELPENG